MAAPPFPGDEPLPAAIGRYRPIKRLGKGGMAEVFLADIAGPGGFRRRVALKTVLPMHSLNPSVTQMFLDEARVGAHFTHPNLVQVYDFGEVDGRYFMAMEYARGLSLRALIRQLRTKSARMPDAIVAAVGGHCCAALAYAHALVDDAGNPMNIVHRDVTPENIFLTVDGVTKVLDFGIARSQGRAEETQAGVIKGKPAYMSPEQAGGKELDGRSDVFALGSTLWELLTTHRLFDAPDMMSTLARIVTQPVPDIRTVVPDCGEALAAVLRSAFERNRDQRPTARDLQSAFDGLVQQSAHSNPQVAIAGFLKGSVPPIPLLSAAGAVRRPVSSPGIPAKPGDTGPQSTPGTPIDVESMRTWPIPASSLMADETMLVEASPAEWDAPAAPELESPAIEVPRPVRPVPGSGLSAFRGQAQAKESDEPLELDDRRAAAGMVPAAPAGFQPLPDAPPPAEDLDRSRPLALWIGVGVGGALVLAGLLYVFFLRAPPVKGPTLIPAPITVPMSFTSQPPGAEIVLDGSDTGHVTPAKVEAAVFDEHTWALTLKGYRRATGKVPKDHLSDPISVTLEVPLQLSVQTTPAGAAIACDGAKVIDETPDQAEVGEGEHLLRATREGFVPAEQKLKVDAEHATWTVTLQPATYLDVQSEPVGASISIDGVAQAEVTPAHHLAVLAGRPHVVALAQENLRASRRVSKAASGATVGVKLRLVDPVAAANDARTAKLVAKQKVLEDEKDRLEAKNSAFIMSGPNDVRDFNRRAKRIEAIDQELNELIQKMGDSSE